MLKDLFEAERMHLNRFFDTLDHRSIETLLHKLLFCQGMPILSGVGKSGHIAEKIAKTFLSTGTRAFFLDPSHALHGDIGFVSPQDLFLAFSKSGETKELLELLPYLKKRQVEIVAIVSNPHSRLAKGADFIIHLPVEKELCPYDLAPTISSTVQLIFGDCLAMALMQAKKFTLEQFADNHPSGLLGRKITFKVSDLMLKGQQLPICTPSMRLVELLHELSNKRCGCLLIVDEGQRLKGIFTDGDLRRTLQEKGAFALNLPIDELMTSSFISISSEELALEAVKKMEKNPLHPITVLPVLEGDRLLGLIRMHDILQKEFS